MAAKIRLTRNGTKKRPFYRVVVADERSPRDGRFIEVLGHYDPQKGLSGAVLNAERVQYWLSCGAQATDTAGHLIREKKILRASA